MELVLDDGAVKIFFNTAGKMEGISVAAINLLEFIENNVAGDSFTEKLAEEVKKIKENKEWQVEYMTLLMREREKYKEGFAEGEARGRAEGARGIIDFALELGYSHKEIISTLQKKLNTTLEQAEDYLEKFYDGTL